MKSHLAMIASVILMLTVAGSMPAASQDTPATTTAEASPNADLEGSINVILDEMHAAAAAADAGRYFTLFSPKAIFLGTDPHERWSFERFWTYAKSRFDAGKGWEYESRQRNVSFNAGRDTAWFDEVLYNDKYGNCRGTGVLAKTGNAWSIMQYSLSIPLPNDMAEDVVRMIQQRGSTSRDLTRIFIVRHAEELKKDGAESGLDRSGQRRARKLAAVLESELIHVVFATESSPAFLTVGPISRQNGMKPQIFSSSNIEFLTTSLRNDYPGRTIVVCGATQSITDMLGYFGVGEGIEIGPRDYDDLFIVTVDTNRMAHLQHLHY